MTARERVLTALGGKCAWCAGTTVLEIDHVHGRGNTHRAAIGMSLERWLCQEFTNTGRWPSGFQLLCKSCHDIKSGRRRMATTKTTKQINVALPEDKARLLEQLAQAPPYDGSKSKLLEAAFDLLLERQAGDMALAGIQQQLSAMQDALLHALQAPRSPAGHETLTQQLTTIEHHLTQRMHTELHQLQATINDAYDRLAQRLPPPRPRTAIGMSRWRVILQSWLRA